MRDPLFVLGNWPVSADQAVLLLGGAVIVLLASIAVLAWRAARARAEQQAAEAARAAEFETHMRELVGAQAELSGRMQTLAEMSVSRQGEVAKLLNDRLDAVSHRLGQNMQEQSQRTGESLSKLHERLAVIDTAQKNITELSSRVVTLQDILANKQQRGAFGQGRMEAIIADALPKSVFTFQATLSNNNRPDCLIHLPDAPGIVVDAKFPLEAFRAFKEAASEEHRRQASAQLKRDVGKHITDIRDKYLIPGEVQDTAIMFVPSEAVYADLYEFFDEVIQKAYRARVVIVSPSMLMLAIQVMQALLKDAKMREQAHLIQKEVTHLLADVGRLQTRVLDLQRHFGQAQQDVDKILTSAEKIGKRGSRIEELEFDEAEQDAEVSLKAVGGQRDLLAGE